MKVIRTSHNGGLDGLRVALQDLEGVTGKVGWFKDAKYEDGTPVAYVAAIQEFGSPGNNIPPRSFMRSTQSDKINEWRQAAAGASRQVLNNKMQAVQAMELIGMKAEGDIREKISQIDSPALRPATIKARQRRYAEKGGVGNLTKPLVDTGRMITSLTSKAEQK